MKNHCAQRSQGSKRGILFVALLSVLCFFLFLFAACGKKDGGPTYTLSVSDDFKSQYYVGQSFVATGSLTIKHSDGSEETYPITEDMISDFDTSSPNQVIIKITYGEYSTSYPIQVLALSATTIELDATTLPSVIYQNAAFPDDVMMTINLADGSTQNVKITSSMLSGFDSSAIGAQNVTVTYLGATASFSLTVKQDERVSISLVSPKTQYGVGEALSTTGTSISVLYESGKESKVAFTADLVEGFSTALGGSFVAKVTYKTFTCDYAYTVNKVATLLELDEDSLPDLFEIGDVFPQGGSALLTYDDGTTEQISLTAEHAAAFTTETFGEKSVELAVSGVSADYTYSVLPAIVRATPFGFTPMVLQGSAFDGFGELIVEYETGDSETIDFSSSRLTVVKYDTSEVGEIEQKLRFRRCEVPFSVLVYSEEERDAVDHIELSGIIPPVKFGDPIDPSNLQVTIIYRYHGSASAPCKSEWINVDLPEEIEGDYLDLPVTVTYKDASEQTWVRVLSAEYALTVTSIHPEGAWKHLYLVEDEIVLENSYLAATYGGGYDVKQSIPILAEYVEGFDTSVAGEKTMTVRYQGAEFTIDYRVIDQEDAERVTSVALYGFDPLLFVGDSLEDLFKEDDSLPSVTVTYGYGYRVDTVDLDVAEMLSGELTEGRCELTLTYEGVTAPVYVTVHPEADKTLLTAIRAPAIVEATVGSEPDFSRYTLSLVYGYGYETRKIPMNSSGVSISEYSTATQGMRHVFVTYTTQDRTFTCDAFLSFTYGTGENVLDRIEVTEGADKEFAEGETFSGVKIRAYYLSGTNKEVEVLPDMVEGFSTEQVGKYEATIVYGGKSAPYSYTVVEAPEAEDPQEQPADPEQQQQPSQQPEEQENGTSNESPEAPAPQPEQPEPQPEV